MRDPSGTLPFFGGHSTPLFLAPQAGVSESPFRRLCRDFGADVVETEFVSADGLVRATSRTLEYLRFDPEERPIGVQIFGPIHGVIFLLFLAAALHVGFGERWSVSTWLLALLGSIVPLGSVIFVIWADRAGKLGPHGPSSPVPAQPVGSAPETT